jgi:hypothetical protein
MGSNKHFWLISAVSAELMNVPIVEINCLKDITFIGKRSREKGKFVDFTHSPSIHQTPEALTKWGLYYVHRWRLAHPLPRALSNCIFAPLPLILRPKEFCLVFASLAAAVGRIWSGSSFVISL